MKCKRKLTVMSNNCLIQVNADFVLQMMTVCVLLTFYEDYHLYHDFDLVIDVVVNRVYRVKHCPDLSCLVSHVARLHHHHQLVQLVIKLVVILVCFPVVGMIHRKPFLVFAVAVIAVVLG